MGGTNEGGLAAARTIKSKYGSDFYKRVGAMGGRKKVPKGFSRMPKAKVIAAGKLGGSRSRKRKP